MNSPKRTPGIDRARDFILHLMEKECPEGKTVLPSLRWCARRADVSLVTMWKAVAALKLEGKLFGKPGRRTALTAADPLGDALVQGADVPLVSLRWKNVSLEIERDILNGLYHPGDRIPLIKEMAARYRVSTKTARKSLALLVEKKLLVPATGGFAVRPLAVRQGRRRSKLVLLGYGSSVYTGFAVGQAHQEFLRRLESRCAQMGVSFDMILYKNTSGDQIGFADGATGRPRRLDDKDDVLGYLAVVVGGEGVCDEVFYTVSRFRKPFAILDEIAGWSLPAALRGNPLVRIFRNTASETAGELAGRFLLGLGHRRVAYFAPFHEYGWSTARYDGLHRVYATVGVETEVKLFAFDSSSFAERYAAATQRSDLDQLLREFRAWLAPRPSSYSFSFETVLKELPDCCMDAEIYNSLQPLFDRALQDPAITAWIAAADSVARTAMDYLKRRGVAVPKQLSVFSFDNRLYSLVTSLTTFDFNMPATVDAMLEFVLHQRTQRRGIPQVTEIEGFIVQRTTTGPAPERSEEMPGKTTTSTSLRSPVPDTVR